MSSENDGAINVMIAGIGGASLGTEILKCLILAGNYKVYGCDISPTAYGLYEDGFHKTYKVDREDYVNSVIEACKASNVNWLIPGGEQPMNLLGAASNYLIQEGITLMSNSSEIIKLFSDKDVTFNKLAEYGISIPKTTAIRTVSDIDHIGLPCIVKPATGTGGSASVFFAVSVDEAMIYAEFIKRNGSQPIAQEYIDIDEGEFTIGVLSLPNKKIVGSIALKRELSAKLSTAYQGRGGIISSGYSQGYIDEFPDLCHQAEKVAEAIGSCGPINVQGRVRDGILYPFEINPRFSASSYLRALAGFNEVDILLKHSTFGVEPEVGKIHMGWYLRSLTERFVSPKEVKQ